MRKLLEEFNQQMRSVQQQAQDTCSAQSSKLDQLLATFQQLSAKQMKDSVQGEVGSPSAAEWGILHTPQVENPSSGRPVRLPVYTEPTDSGTQAENEACKPHHFQPKPKNELTMFDKTEARYWVRQCNRYFDYYNTTEREKVQVASSYFDKKG